MSDLAREVKTELQRIMESEGISQNEIQRRTGIAQTAISQLLKGNREIQTGTIERIALAIGMRPHITFKPSREVVGAH